MGITLPQQLNIHPLRGSIFETFIVSELVKKRTNVGKRVNLYYWRDKTGYEIDVIIDNVLSLLPVEIKSGKTITSEFFRNMLYWLNLSGEKSGYVLYAGDQEQKRSNGITVAGWERLRERDFLRE
jgi:predicted AAA+ superfamily ATPase